MISSWAVDCGVVTLICRASVTGLQPERSRTHTACSTSRLVPSEMNRWARNWSACMATSNPWEEVWLSSIESRVLAS